MKYLKIYENFMDSRNSGIVADLEAGEIENDQIYAGHYFARACISLSAA